MIIYLQIGIIVTILGILMAMLLLRHNWFKEWVLSDFGTIKSVDIDDWDKLNMDSFLRKFIVVISPLLVLLWPILIIANIYVLIKEKSKES